MHCMRVCVIAYTKVIIEGGADLHWFDIPSIFPSLLPPLVSPPSLISFPLLSSPLLSSYSVPCSLSYSAFSDFTAILGPKHKEFYLRFDYACGLPYLHLNSSSSDHAHTNADVITLFVCPILLKISFSKKTPLSHQFENAG